MAERVTFVLIPPLALIFLVLGTIFLGIATPTEGGAMGAIGALVMALARRRIDLKLLRQAMDTTMKLSCFVALHPDRLDRLQPVVPGASTGRSGSSTC